MDMLNDVFGQNFLVGDICGCGFFIGMEFVVDCDIKVVFDFSYRYNVCLKVVVFEVGLICYLMGGMIDGKYGDYVLLVLFFILEFYYFEEVVDKFGVVVVKVFVDLGL